MHISYLEARALTTETAGAEGAEATLVGESGQRIHLIHELRQLRRAEELLDGCHHRTDVDQRLGGDGLNVLGGHAFTHDTLHTAETDPHLILDQLTDAADAAIGEVILIVEAIALVGICQVQQVGTRGKDLSRREHVQLIGRNLDVDAEQITDLLDLHMQLAIELVTAHLGEVVALGIEEGVFEVGTGRLDGGRLAGAGLLVYLDEALFARGEQPLLFLPLTFEEGEVVDKTIQKTGVRVLGESESTEDDEHRQATLTGHAGTSSDVFSWLLLDVELNPLAAIRMHRARHQRFGIATRSKDDTR